MSVVIEHVGAQRGSLLLSEGGRMEVAAEAVLGPGHEAVSIAVPRPASALPSSVLHFVERTRQHVLLDDASSQHRFRSDPYFGAQHRSMLCKPILGGGRLIGVFFLENDLLAGAFNPARLAILDVLAGQTAISIENSRLYQSSLAAVAARDEFLALAAHELRTPLTPLSLQMDRLIGAAQSGTLKTMSDDAVGKIATRCESQITRLSRLVTALLDVARIGKGKLLLQREHADLGALVSTALDEHAKELAAAGCSVSLQVEAGLVAHCDAPRLTQVMTNLLLNASKFGRGRPIEATLRREGEHARLVVVDHGIGIAAGDRERVFGRSERVGTVDNVDGLGLGLFVVRAIVEAHGGRVVAGETAGGGATLEVWLPLAAPQ